MKCGRLAQSQNKKGFEKSALLLRDHARGDSGMTSPAGLVLTNAHVLVVVPDAKVDTTGDDYHPGVDVASLKFRYHGDLHSFGAGNLSCVMTQGECIKEVYDNPVIEDCGLIPEDVLEGSFDTIDCHGMTLMPGLIDSHVHVTASSANLRMPSTMPPSLLYARAVPILSGMLDRGFTTVRDCGGADHGLVTALDENTLRGPRVVHGGKALSTTGGHGDFRTAGQNVLNSGFCKCCDYTIGRVCDGIAECRTAVRDEIRKGARHIKVMASGGVASPTDRLENLQFSEEELLAIVEEASNAKVYVAAHAYTDEAIQRAIKCGIRSIEHGNFASPETLELLKSSGGFLVPTLITYHALKKEGVTNGMAAELVAKVGDLVERGQRTLLHATQKNVPVCYGSDLLGDMHKYQAGSIPLHLEAGLSNQDVIASLTAVPGARVPEQRGGLRAGSLHGVEPRDKYQRGVIKPSALADLILVKGDVLEDPTVLCDERNVVLVIKGGKVVKSLLAK